MPLRLVTVWASTPVWFSIYFFCTNSGLRKLMVNTSSCRKLGKVVYCRLQLDFKSKHFLKSQSVVLFYSNRQTDRHRHTQTQTDRIFSPKQHQNTDSQVEPVYCNALQCMYCSGSIKTQTETDLVLLRRLYGLSSNTKSVSCLRLYAATAVCTLQYIAVY